MFAVVAALFVAGCVPRGRDSAYAENAKYDIVPVHIVGKALKADLPPGWARTRLGMLNDPVDLALVNPRTGARIDALAFPAETNSAALLYRAKERLPSSTTSLRLTATTDGLLEFTYADKSGACGRVYLKNLADGGSALVVGAWGKNEDDDSVPAAFDFASSIDNAVASTPEKMGIPETPTAEPGQDDIK